MSERCADVSEAAGEPLAATAVTARTWLLLEVPGAWPRDVAQGAGLTEHAEAAVSAWIARTPGARLQFVRRPGRTAVRPLAFRVEADEDRRQVCRIELAGPEDLASVDLARAGEPVERSLVLVCGHGSRDRCCAVRGSAVYGELSQRLGDEELWISSHQGGHRFAANVLALPHGLQFGRVETVAAPSLVARALAGRIELDRYRGRTCYEPPVQAAEVAIRVAAGLDAVDDLRLAGVEDGLVRFLGADGREWAVAVGEAEGPAVPASCGAEPAAQRTYVARLV